MSLGFAVSPVVLDLLVSKFDKSGGRNKAIEYDNFIEYVFFFLFLGYSFLPDLISITYINIHLFACRCCLTVKVST